MTEKLTDIPEYLEKNSEVAADILYLASEESSLNFPNKANIAREAQRDSEKSLIAFKGEVFEIVDLLEEDGFLTEVEMYGKKGAYRTTYEGEELLEHTET